MNSSEVLRDTRLHPNLDKTLSLSNSFTAQSLPLSLSLSLSLSLCFSFLSPVSLPNHRSSPFSLLLQFNSEHHEAKRAIFKNKLNLLFASSHSIQALAMAVTEQHQPHEAQINGGAQPPIASTSTATMENVAIPKRQRRPSVRLGEIGDLPASVLAKQGKTLNKGFRTRPLTNLGFPKEGGQEEERENLDDLAIGSWKIKGSKSKRPRTSWVSKIDDGEDGFSRDFEVVEDSPVNSMENERDLNFRVPQNSRARSDDRVELDGQDDDGGQSARGWGREDGGIRVWLNRLGLGRYWPIFEIHGVDEEVLPFLTLEDLKDMGINAVGTRRKMFCAIQKLDKVCSVRGSRSWEM